MKEIAPLLLLLAAAALVSPVAGKAASFEITLSGTSERPTPVITDATGTAEVVLSGQNLRFELKVCSITGVTQAHIHVGSADIAGPFVLFLYPLDPSGFFSTVECTELSEGRLRPADLIPRPAIGINNWNDFVAALLSGNTYVNVHTLTHPGGEIRGQLSVED